MVWACGLWIRCAPSFMLIFLLYLDSLSPWDKSFLCLICLSQWSWTQSQNLEGNCAGPHFKITALGCTDCFGEMNCKQSNWGCWRWKMVEISYKQFQKAFTSNLGGHSAAGKARWNCCLIFPSSFSCLISGILFPSLLLLLPIHALLLIPWDSFSVQENKNLIRSRKTIQGYITSFEPQAHLEIDHPKPTIEQGIY